MAPAQEAGGFAEEGHRVAPGRAKAGAALCGLLCTRAVAGGGISRSHRPGGLMATTAVAAGAASLVILRTTMAAAMTTRLPLFREASLKGLRIRGGRQCGPAEDPGWLASNKIRRKLNQ